MNQTSYRNIWRFVVRVSVSANVSRSAFNHAPKSASACSAVSPDQAAAQLDASILHESGLGHPPYLRGLHPVAKLRGVTDNHHPTGSRQGVKTPYSHLLLCPQTYLLGERRLSQCVIWLRVVGHPFHRPPAITPSCPCSHEPSSQCATG